MLIHFEKETQKYFMKSIYFLQLLLWYERFVLPAQRPAILASFQGGSWIFSRGVFKKLKILSTFFWSTKLIFQELPKLRRPYFDQIIVAAYISEEKKAGLECRFSAPLIIVLEKQSRLAKQSLPFKLVYFGAKGLYWMS